MSAKTNPSVPIPNGPASEVLKAEIDKILGKVDKSFQDALRVDLNKVACYIEASPSKPAYGYQPQHLQAFFLANPLSKIQELEVQDAKSLDEIVRTHFGVPLRETAVAHPVPPAGGAPGTAPLPGLQVGSGSGAAKRKLELQVEDLQEQVKKQALELDAIKKSLPIDALSRISTDKFNQKLKLADVNLVCNYIGSLWEEKKSV
jgi:hypothetical protein